MSPDFQLKSSHSAVILNEQTVLQLPLPGEIGRIFAISRSWRRESLLKYLADQTVSITDGVGTVGEELIRQIFQCSPKEIRVVDN